MLDEADRDVLKTLTVLYVEDDAETVTQARRYLQPRVGSLLTAEDGGEALQLFEQHRPDIVATDIRIPGPDGLEITENIRERSPSTPVILITAFESTDYLRRAVNAGVEQYVIKPIDTERLDQALARAARRIAVEREATALAQRALDASLAREEDLRAYLDGSAVGVLGIDASLKTILHANQGACELLGYSASELLTLGRSDVVVEDESEGVAQVEALRRHGRPAIEVERHLRRKDGSILHVLMSVRRVITTAGQARAVIVFSDLQRFDSQSAATTVAHASEIAEFRSALNAAGALPPIITVCMFCKQVRDDDHGSAWVPLASYLQRHTKTQVSHGMCDPCVSKQYPEYIE